MSRLDSTVRSSLLMEMEIVLAVRRSHVKPATKAVRGSQLGFTATSRSTYFLTTGLGQGTRGRLGA